MPSIKQTLTLAYVELHGTTVYRRGRMDAMHSFESTGSSRRRRTVLLAGAAARSNGTDDSSVHSDEYPALGRNWLFRKGQESGIAGGVLIGKSLARPPKHDSGARFGLG
jgi:hypothetical protein